MSLLVHTAVGTRIGWFDKDPVKTATLNDGNFVSSTDAAANAPADSFMVYVGVPVEPVAGADNDFRCSDGTAGTNGNGMLEIFDVQRRWFSEVVAINQAYREILSKSGVNGQTAFSVTLPNSVIQPMLDAQAGAERQRARRLPRQDQPRRRRHGSVPERLQLGDGGRGDHRRRRRQWQHDRRLRVGRLDRQQPGDTGDRGLEDHRQAGGHLLPRPRPQRRSGLQRRLRSARARPTRQCHMVGKVISAGDHDSAGEARRHVHGCELQGPPQLVRLADDQPQVQRQRPVQRHGDRRRDRGRAASIGCSPIIYTRRRQGQRRTETSSSSRGRPSRRARPTT